jgi:NifB/MoaA-like Fe-S oxidoreductase
LTRYRSNLPKLTAFTADIARKTIAQTTQIQRKLKREIGTPFAFLGDEIYIMAGAEIPGASHYAGFPQIENGVGMVRTFLTQFKSALRTGTLTRRAGPPASPASPASLGRRGTVCTGTVFYPYLKDCVDQLGMDLKTIAIESKFWGSGIGVAGLLTGSDFIAALKGRVYGDFVVLPSECMAGDDYLFLDDLTLKDVERELGVPVIPSGYHARDFVKFLRST